MIICPTCSLENSDDDDHCGRCGRPLNDIAAPSNASKNTEASENIDSAPSSEPNTDSLAQTSSDGTSSDEIKTVAAPPHETLDESIAPDKDNGADKIESEDGKPKNKDSKEDPEPKQATQAETPLSNSEKTPSQPTEAAPPLSTPIPIRGGAITGELTSVIASNIPDEEKAAALGQSPLKAAVDVVPDDPWLSSQIQKALDRSSSKIEESLQQATEQLKVRKDSRRPRQTIVEGLAAVSGPPPTDRISVREPSSKTVPMDVSELAQLKTLDEKEGEDLRQTVPIEALRREERTPFESSELATMTEEDLRTTSEDLPTVGKKGKKALLSEPPNNNPFNSFLPGLLVGILIGILITGVGAGIILGVQRQNNEAKIDDDSATTPTKATTTIPAGPFLKGLSNDYRLMFAELCKKTAKEPDTECKEDIALKNEYPQATVEVPAFVLDTFEVSNNAWSKCIKADACKPIDYKQCTNRTTRGLRLFERVSAELEHPERPVVCVSQKQAEAFCTWKNGSLPTPDQWEKAARGKDAYLFPWGTNWNPSVANWAEKDMLRVLIDGQLDGEIWPAKSGTYPKGASPFNIMDMAGNVAEWVKLAKDADPLTATARGGSWVSSPLELRTTHRLFLKPETRRTDVGFRCAYTASE